jgi:hypothetical protein
MMDTAANAATRAAWLKLCKRPAGVDQQKQSWNKFQHRATASSAGCKHLSRVAAAATGTRNKCSATYWLKLCERLLVGNQIQTADSVGGKNVGRVVAATAAAAAAVWFKLGQQAAWT